MKAIINGRLIDGTGAEPVDNMTVLIEGAKIKAVGQDIEIPDRAEIIDSKGKTVMPGLIDSHMHHWGVKTSNLTVEGVVRPQPLTLIKAIYDSKACLAAGFTTVKDCGGMNGVYLKRSVAEGTLRGLPRIIAAGYTLTQTWGHTDIAYFPPECVDVRTSKHHGRVGDETLLCDGVDECIKATRYALRHGSDFIKVMTTPGGYSDRGLPFDVSFLNPDEIESIVQTASQVGKFVSTHCLNSSGAKNSILGGIKTIDHATDINDEVIGMAKEAGAIFVSSLAITRATIDHGAEAGKAPWMIEWAKTMWDMACESYNKMLKADAVLAAATDFTGPPTKEHGDNAIELELLVNYCGFTPMDAIKAATKNGAMACFMGEKTGTIESGKFADIIILDGNPLENISLLRDKEKIKMVMLEGKVEIDRST